jgi:hypothetical protein
VLPFDIRKVFAGENRIGRAALNLLTVEVSLRVSASFAKITRSSSSRTTTPSLSSSRIVSISRSQSGVSMVVLGIVLFISIAIPLQGYRIVCVAQFSRVPWVAVHQPSDRGEQKAD